MIKIIVNDLSFVGQADGEQQAALLLRELALALTALLNKLGTASVHRPHTIKQAMITPKLSLGAYLSVSSATMRKDERDLLLRQLTKGPYLEKAENSSVSDISLPLHTCQYNKKPLAFTAIAYVAYLTTNAPFYGTYRPAALLSLGQAPDYAAEELEVEFINQTPTKTKTKKKSSKTKNKTSADPTMRQIWNVTAQEQVLRVCRKYKANDGKHAQDEKLGGFISPMDLRDDQAIQVLADGVNPHGDKRVFGRYGGKLYVFPCHSKEANEFHGFVISAKDIQTRMGDVYGQLRAIGFFDET